MTAGIFRGKGLVRFTQAARVFNYVPGRVDFEDFQADSPQLVFIGRFLKGEREQIMARLRDCED